MPDRYPFKDLILYFIFARAFFLGNEIYTKNANFLFIDLAKLPINNDNVIPILFSSYHHCHVNHMPINISKLPYVSICSRLIAISLYRYCALYWPIVILVNPLYFLFLWPDFVIALYIALYKGHLHRIYLSVRLDSLDHGGLMQFDKTNQALFQHSHDCLFWCRNKICR